MTSFGHAAWFGLGAYGAALLLKLGALPMEAALLLGPLAAALGALVFGWFCVRLSGVYLAMLTLAVAQILWATAFQWDDVTGGSNGLTGLWPAAWLSSGPGYYYLTLALCALGVWWLRRLAFAPLGYAARRARLGPARRSAGHGHAPRAMGGLRGRLAGRRHGRFAVRLFQGSIAPDAMAVGRSVDGLVMVLLGGLQSLAGPLAGAAAYTWLQDAAARSTEYWHALLGLAILALVMAFPDGLAGAAARWTRRLSLRAPRNERPALLQVRDLRKSFGGIDALAGVSFTLQAGQMLALIGPNGAGKSTCFNALGGRSGPTRARCAWTAANWSACPPRASAASAWAARSRPPPCSAP